MAKAWGGRFQQATDARVEAFTESISFDARLFEFLAQRIAEAILKAYQRQQDATAYWLDTSVPNFARNRSLEPFLLNPESGTMLITVHCFKNSKKITSCQ